MSEAWQAFKKQENGVRVICLLCNKSYSNPGSNTTNLWNHLKGKHKSKYIELDQIRRGVTSSNDFE